MSARDDQRQQRELNIGMLDEGRIDMPLEMIHRDQRLLQRVSHRFGKGDTHQKGANQTRTLRNRDAVNVGIFLAGLAERAPDHVADVAQMFATGKLRHHAPEAAMGFDLRSDDIGQDHDAHLEPARPPSRRTRIRFPVPA